MTDDDRDRVDDFIRSATGGAVRGLTVLDHFAAAALQGLLAWSPSDTDTNYEPDRAAKLAYEHAMAMMDRRRDLVEEWQMQAAGEKTGTPAFREPGR